MNTQQIELARRVVSSERFRWMPGMRTLGDWRVINVDSDGVEVVTDLSEVVLFHSGDLPHIPSSLPDLNDPATLGCLLALVREICGDSEMHLTLGGADWVWLSGESRVANVVLDIPAGKTEAEAITLALEAAP